MVDIKKMLHNEDHDPIPSNYVSGQDAYGRKRAGDGIFSYLFLPFTMALLASICASEAWLAMHEPAERTFAQIINFQILATIVAMMFGARGLGRRLLAGFLVWCVWSVHIVVLAAEGRIEMMALLETYMSQDMADTIVKWVPFF